MRKPLVVAAVFAILAAGCSHGGSSVIPGGASSPQMTTPQSISPALVSPAPMAHTEILPASAMTSPATHPDIPVSTLNWTPIPGTASTVAAAPDGSLWALSDQPSSSADKYIWHYSNGSWTNISGLASQLAVASDGTLWALNSGGGIWHYAGGNWTSPGGGASKSITADANGAIYVLSNGGSGNDRAIWKYTSGGGWVQQNGSGVALAANLDTNTFSGSPGTIAPGGFYILNSAGGIWYENSNGTFAQLPGTASAIAPTTNGGVFVLGYPVSPSGNQVYYYDLNTPGWTAEPGAGLLSISAGTNLFLVSSNGSIYNSSLPQFGDIASITVTTSNNAFTTFTKGLASSVTLIVTAKDVNGKTITGTYTNPIQLTILCPNCAADGITVNGSSGSPSILIPSSSTNVQLAYNGSASFTGARVSAWTTSGGVQQNRLGTFLLKGPCSLPAGTSRQGYFPCDLQSAYNFTAASSANGSGQTIAIVDAYDDPTAESDLAVYRAAFGLPACTSNNGCFTKRAQDGSVNYPIPDAGWAGEITLDLDMASAICPNCKLLLVEANSNSNLNLYTAEDEAVVLGATEISNSWGGPENSGALSSEIHFNHPGVPITVSSGDDAFSGGTQYPASSAWVTAVGGTNLLSTTNTRGWIESAWGCGANTACNSGAGSGCSLFISKPVWQTDTTCTKRMVADVSAVADPNTGVWTYGTYQSYGWSIFGGTSASAPIIAGVYALSGNASTVVAGSFPYSHTSALNDVTLGGTGTCTTSYYCNAQTGYDGPTGLGTPNTASGAFIRPMERDFGPPVRTSLNYHPGPSRAVCPELQRPGYSRCFALLRTDNP